MIKIQLTQGKTAIVSDIDSDLNNFKWHYHHTGYAQRHNPNKRPRQLLMHRVILERMLGRSLVKGEFTDHINGNKLDNRRENLRLATKAENCRNRGATANNTSGFKGVSWVKRDSKWRADIEVNGKQIYLGLFGTPELAHEAYCKAADKYHGEFAGFD